MRSKCAGIPRVIDFGQGKMLFSPPQFVQDGDDSVKCIAGPIAHSNQIQSVRADKLKAGCPVTLQTETIQ